MTRTTHDTEADVAADVQRYRDGELPPETFGTLLEGVLRDTVDRPPRWRDRLRELSTPVRVLLAAVALAMAAALATRGVLRPDLAGVDLAAVALALIAFGGLAVASVELALRGMHAPTSASRWQVLLGIAVAAPLGASAVPLWPGVDTAGPGWLQAAVGCGTPGLLASVVAAAAVLLLQRDDRPALWRIAAAGTAGGMAGLVGRVASCPGADPAHMVLAHGGLALVTAALCVVAVQARRALAR